MKCINKWENQNNCKQCAVCNKNELVHIEVLLNYTEYKLCSDHCFAAFKFVNNVDAGSHSSGLKQYYYNLIFPLYHYLLKNRNSDCNYYNYNYYCQSLLL